MALEIVHSITFLFPRLLEREKRKKLSKTGTRCNI